MTAPRGAGRRAGWRAACAAARTAGGSGPAWTGGGGARVGERREQLLELRAQILVLDRQAQRLAEVLGVLVDGEAGRGRGDLEQDALRLLEVDGVEVVAVDHRRDVHAGPGDALLPGDVLVVARVPGDVVHGAGALHAALVGGVVAPVEVAFVAFEAVLAVGDLVEAEDLGQQPAVGVQAARVVGSRAVDAEDRVFGRDV